MTPVLIAVDPGDVPDPKPGEKVSPTRRRPDEASAVVAVAAAPRGRVAVIASRMIAATPEAFDRVLAELGATHRISAVAIEWAEGTIFNKYRSAGLLAAQGTGGEYAGVAWARGHLVLKVPAARHRAAVVGRIAMTTAVVLDKKTGKPRRKRVPVEDTDALVARALPTFVDGMERTNVHQRDALCLAVYAAREVWKRGVAA